MTPVDKLVRSIAQVLDGGGVRSDMDRLAAEYGNWCAKANRRLEQCRALLENGAEHEALILAETPPSLLDLCAALSFHRSDQWRSLCKSKNLTEAEQLNERAISCLNDLYSNGITSAHPLYREYRAAIAERNYDRALSVLRTIVRLNPSDANARQEIKRLEQKLCEDTLARLTQAVQDRNVPIVLEALDQLESSGAHPPHGGSVMEAARAIRHEWEREQAFARCCRLIEWLDDAREREAWREALGPIQEVEQLSQQYSIALDSEARERFAIVRTWAFKLRQEQDAEEQFRTLLREIEFLVEQGVTGDTPSVGRNLKSLRDEHHSLVSKWRELETFTKPMPEAIQTRVKRRVAVLQAEINRLVRQRRMATTIGVVALAACVTGAAMWVFRLRWTENQIAELEKLRHERRLSSTEQFIASLRKTQPKAAARPKLAVAIQKSEQWLTEERVRLDTLQKQVERLQRHASTGFTDASIQEVALQWQQARQFAESVAPELRHRMEAEFLEFENQLDTAVVAELNRVQERFRDLLRKAEQVAGKLEQRDATLGVLRENTVELANVLAQLELIANPPVQKLRLPDSLTGRVAPLRAKLTPYQESLNWLDKAEAEMRRAKTLDEYLGALERYDADYLRQISTVRAARMVANAKSTLFEIDRLLLMPDDADGWTYFKKNPNAPKMPAEVMPTERARWLDLRDDENLNRVHRYQLPKSLLEEMKEMRPVLLTGSFYTRGPIGNPLMHGDSIGGQMWFTATYYYPADTDVKPNFERKEFRCEYRVGVSGDVNPAGGLTAESALLKRIGMDRWIDATGEKFQQPLLPMIDELRSADGVSPLFKAHVHLRLLDILALRPESWGAHWIPAIAKDRIELREIGATELRSGDWMVPAKVGKYGQKISEFYARTHRVTYTKQGALFSKLVRDAEAAGFRYAGFVSGDGVPVLTAEGSRARSLWGLTADDLRPSLLWRVPDGKSDFQPVGRSQPLTPLFLCGREPTELLKAAFERAQIDPGSPHIGPYLPPLFQRWIVQ